MIPCLRQRESITIVPMLLETRNSIWYREVLCATLSYQTTDSLATGVYFFFLRAVWCLISATRCCDSTLFCFWFNKYTSSQAVVPGAGAVDAHSVCWGWTGQSPGAQGRLLFSWTLISLQCPSLPGHRECHCNSVIAGGISLGCASPWLKRRSTFCQRILLQLTPGVWVPTAEWHMVARVEVHIIVVSFPSCRIKLAGLPFHHRLTTCHNSFLLLEQKK